VKWNSKKELFKKDDAANGTFFGDLIGISGILIGNIN